MLILLSSGIVPYSYATVASEAQEDLNAGCRSEQTLVYRFTSHDYVCVAPSTADRWVELGFAEIKQNYAGTKVSESNTDVTSYEEKYPGAPPLPPTKSSSTNTDSECRDGQVLIYQFSYQDTFCTNRSTALTWERLGIAEIVHVVESKEIINYSEVEPEQSEVEPEQSEVEPEQSEVEPEQSEVEPEQSVNVSESDLENDFSFPTINHIHDNIWFITDFDNARSVIVEGRDGLIVINSLNSYESVKKSFEKFKSISDKPIKIIIFTKINPDVFAASDALIEEGDGSVEIIIHEDILDLFLDDYEVEIPNLVSFSSKFTIDVSDIQMDLLSADYGDSYQTYIFIPEIDGFVIGDSDYGIMPFILEMRELENFLE
jgi:hypothetical protein